MKVYLVIHYEIMTGEVVDAMLFHTASSLPKAIEYIKHSGVDCYSWWEIQVQKIDDKEWPEHLGWFGRRGGKIKKPPIEKAIEAFRKCKADPLHHLYEDK